MSRAVRRLCASSRCIIPSDGLISSVPRSSHSRAFASDVLHRHTAWPHRSLHQTAVRNASAHAGGATSVKAPCSSVQPPLDQPLPGYVIRFFSHTYPTDLRLVFDFCGSMCSIPASRPLNASLSPAVQCTTLSNGLRVVSQENYGQVATIALFVDAGSMYEDEVSIGTSPQGLQWLQCLIPFLAREKFGIASLSLFPPFVCLIADMNDCMAS